ncbi:MAG: gliding motility lipoprotein GldH [Bacteroidota bacterium]|nr:gliding motility lipoprotein GldH [uncultured Allomuricauda sp.]
MRNPILCGLCLFLSFFSCTPDLEFSEYQTLKKGEWAIDQPINFQFSKENSLQPRNLYLHIRNDNSYPFSNLFLITELEFPSGNTQKDTLEYLMAEPNGNWLGKGLGSVKENKLWYKESIVLPDSGVYTIRINHAMRKNGDVQGITVLNGITDVGLEIEKISR